MNFVFKNDDLNANVQEVIKKTGKFTPIEGWMHHEDSILIPEDEAAVVPAGTRYDDYITVLGADFIAKAADQRVFLVGAGALGCEYIELQYKWPTMF